MGSNNKIEELTKKIYNEGISQANEEAKKIIDAANQKSAEILEEAKKEEEKILKDAEKKAAETSKNILSELKLASNQLQTTLKQSITELIISKSVKNETSSLVKDQNFFKTLIEKLMLAWVEKDQNLDINLLLGEKDAQDLLDYFKSNQKNLLDKGLEIKDLPQIKSGFKITPKDGSYIISFTEDDFINLFKYYLRPKTVEMLFEK